METHSNQHLFTIKNVKTIDGQIVEHVIPCTRTHSLDARGQLTLFPALIDPHVHFQKEDRITQTKDAIAGGITTVLEMPNQHAPCHTKAELEAFRRQIDQQLIQSKNPLRCYVYFSADQNHLEEISKVKNLIVGLMVEMDSYSTHTLDRLFQIAAQENIILTAHTKQEAVKGVHQAIDLAEKYSTELVLSLSNKKEIDLVRQAKTRGLLVHAEVPVDLFLTGKENEALWTGIEDETIDMIGGGCASSNISNLRNRLPLLLNAYFEKRISLEKIVHLTRINVERNFRLIPNPDVVLVDLQKKQEVQGKILQGWPVYTILKGEIFPFYS